MSQHITDIKNFILINDHVATAGQPTAEQFETVRKEGYEVVVNLLPSQQDNALKGEDRLIHELGMGYHYIPVAWAAPKLRDFQDFCKIMQNFSDNKLIVHCAMNMRVTAFYSSYAMKYLGWRENQADAPLAQAWGASSNFNMNDTWRAFLSSIRSYFFFDQHH